MATANACFWTAHGRDSSETMGIKSQAICTKVPRSRRVEVLSGSTVKTIVVTLQGAQAIVMLMNGLAGHIEGSFTAITMGMDSIFLPVSVFGLLRLPAALWLTEDYSYAEYNVREVLSTLKPDQSLSPPAGAHRGSETPTSLHKNEPSSSELYHPSSSWRSRIMRAIFLMPIFGLLAVSILFMRPHTAFTATQHLAHPTLTATTLLLNLTCITFLVTTLTSFSIYFGRGRHTDTIIPCISSLWYKIYTGLLIALMLALIVVAGLQTRKTPCGLYTTLAKSYDESVCGGNLISADQEHGLFGLAWKNSTSPAIGRKMGIYPFAGWCKGHLDELQAVVPSKGTRNHTTNF